MRDAKLHDWVPSDDPSISEVAEQQKNTHLAVS
jgi:hypothetical protein